MSRRPPPRFGSFPKGFSAGNSIRVVALVGVKSKR